jgi:phosphoglycerate dehydrogenase-like enzyme
MKILIDVPIDETALSEISQSGEHEIVVIEAPAEHSRTIDPARISDTEVLFCTFPPTNFADMKRLRWIQIASAGYTQLLDLDLPTHGIQATNALGCFDCPIAEWNIAMMVNLARDIRQLVRNQEARSWDRSAKFQREIRGLTVGIWGYGGIGRETARLAHLIGLRVHVMTRHGVGPRINTFTVPGTGDPEGKLPDKVFRSGETETFLQDLDFLVVALPLTDSTKGLIGERELRALPNHACILNPSRGPIIQEEPLLRALSENWIAGAAIDTHYHYPMPPDHPLWQFPNVIFTPHISGSSLSPNFVPRLWHIFSANLANMTQGKPLINELSLDQLSAEP